MGFAEGDPALLIDSKGRQYLLKLDPARTFQYHQGSIHHTDLIGRDDGSWVESSLGAVMLLLSPRLADYVLRMKRSAQVVYPKDLGPILVYGDIAPGMTVVEAGTGSGALTMGLARVVGETGKVFSVDVRADHQDHARKAITRWFGAIPAQLELRVGDVVDVVEEIAPERIVLDLPEPDRAITAGSTFQPLGGVLVAYLPTVPQVEAAVNAGRESGGYTEIEVKEFLVRDWNVSGRSVRPEHQMVGHTGFLVFMRRVAHR